MDNLYQALYRTYRPKTFKDVIGQDVVCKTLKNALAVHKTAQAYLFSGPRGTGKTSIARIFAKALNCPNAEEGNPCGECEVCQSITEGINPDVIEIDAASNNGVEQIRDIRDKVKYLPTALKYKVYIIDEVHMLTTGAFNALLKTLEEPPAHVVFIMATTEIQKVPATILSRCQHFDFKPLATPEIMQGLKSVCDKENISIEEDALADISESAEGGMRDALSYLDQARSYGNDHITINEVNAVTGNLNYQNQISLATFIHDHNITEAINAAHEVLDSGKEAAKVVSNMIEFYRDMMMYKAMNVVRTEGHKLYRYIYALEDFKTLSQNIKEAELYYNIETLNNALQSIKYSQNPSLYLEIALMKMSSVSDSDFDLFAKYNALERKLNTINENGSGVITVSSDNNEELEQLNTRLNKITAELTRLELPRLSERVSILESRPSSVSDKNNQLNYDILNTQIMHLDERCKILETNKSENDTSDLEGIKETINRLEETLKDTSKFDSLALNITSKYQSLEKDVNDFVKDTTDRLETLEENNGLDFEDEESLKEGERLDQLDSRLASLEIRVQEENHDKEEALNERLSKLEANASDNLVNRIEVLEDMVNTLVSRDVPKEEEPVFQLDGSYTEEPDDDLYNVLLSRVDNLTTRLTKCENNPEFGKIYQRLDTLEQETINVALPLDNALLDERLKQIESKIQTNNEISEKVTFLEKKVYGLLASELGKKKSVSPKESNLKEGALFSDDILNGQRSNFEGLEQTQSELEKEAEEVAALTLEEPNTEEQVQEQLQEQPLEFTQEEILDSNNSEALEETEESSVLEFNEEQVQEQSQEQPQEQAQEVIQEENLESNDDKIESNENFEPVEEQTLDFIDDTNVENNEQPQEHVQEQVQEQFLENLEVKTTDNLETDSLVDEPEVKDEQEPLELSTEVKEESTPITNEDSLENTKSSDSNREVYSYTTDSEKVVIKEKSALSIKIDKPVEQEDESVDEFARFSVKVIERILNNALKPECKNDKKRIEEIWSTRLNDVRDKDEKLIADCFSRGSIAAVGDHEFIIIFPNAISCNQTMAPKFKKKAISYLTYLLGAEYNYMSLPQQDWLNKRVEYISQYNMGFKEPKLTPIKNPALKVMASSESQDASVKKAQELFGDIVKVE